MSPQLSPVRNVPLEILGETGALIFGEAWRSPLTIPKALIAKIWGQVEEGVRILPRGGAEIGGLLVGPNSRENGVVVDGIIPLSIEYEHGPSFRMSASDLAKIAVLVESVQVDPSKAVVGFYRSQTRGNETFRDSDREIFDAIEQKHRSFAADFLCYFVLAPVSKSEMSACISMWNGEDWDGMRFTLRSNPFSVVQAPSSVARQVSLPTEVQVSRPIETTLVPTVLQTVPPLAAEHGPTLPEPRPLFHAVLSAVKAAGRPSKRLYAAAGLLVLAGAVGGYRWIVKNSAEPTSVPPSRMGFSANREGPVWRLSWDRGAIESMTPSSVVLAIKDDDSEQQLNLTPADLSSGTIFYNPKSGDLVFSLRLERGGGTPLEEHVRVLEGPSSVQKSAERSPQTLSNNPAVESQASPRGSVVPTKLPNATISGTGRATPVNPFLSPLVQANPAPAETTAARTSIREVPPDLAETLQPPAVAFAVPVAPRLARSVGELPPLPAPAPPGAANPGGSAASKSGATAPEGVVPNAPSAGSSTLSTVTAPAPSAAVLTPVKPNYTGPKAVQQVRPQPPANLNSSGVQIQIHIEIDARGKVTNATPIGVTAANFPLISVAVRASRSWQFEPAKMDGRPVPSEMNLVFRF